MTESWPRIAVVGAGAVGSYFGGAFARAGAPVILIGRKPFVEAANANGLIIDRAEGQQQIPVKASEEMKEVAGANLILVCVKSNDTVMAAKEMTPFLNHDALIVSLQNGVDNADKIRQVTGADALPAAVYIAASVPESGRIKHLARGDLILGPENKQTLRAQDIFTRAQIPCRLTSNIDGEMWIKLLCNCALNAISALGHARYGQIAADPDARELMQGIVNEVLAVAAAAGVILPNISDPKAGMAAAMNIATQMTEAFSSTAQDLQRKKMTEIDSLNGYIARRGAELGVGTPINHALFALVKLAEQSFSK